MEQASQHAIKTFILKHPKGCTGHYRRMLFIPRSPYQKNYNFDDARSKAPVALPLWPQPNCLIRGTLHNMKKKVHGSFDWIEVKEIQQPQDAGEGKWTPIPSDVWLPAWREGMVIEEVK